LGILRAVEARRRCRSLAEPAAPVNAQSQQIITYNQEVIELV
jgi:hypothetical protein